jgi:ssDNA-binding Zn-finger/Zn-ribbon topoisomerase 1
MKLRRGKFSLFWGCTLFPKCRGTHGAHPDGQPLGKPADSATKAARIRAHEVFDRLWKTHNLSRRQAYMIMQRVLDMSADEAHIAKFSIKQCERLISEFGSIGGFVIFKKQKDNSTDVRPRISTNVAQIG